MAACNLFIRNCTHLFAALALAALLFACNTSQSGNSVSETVDKLEDYVVEHHQTPEEYVVSKFADHDIVILGERHRLKHDVKLVRDLIPLLHEAGVYHLGSEFADWADQPLIDSLLALPEYDEALARQIQFNEWPWWGYQDYIDIYRAAWEVNRNRPEGTPPFRVIGLSARTDWSYVRTPEDLKDRATRAKIFPEGDVDEHMARVIEREFVAQNQKALIYSGHSHAFTRYHQPAYNFEKGELVRLNERRMGNLVYAAIGDRCFNIFLHTPWYAATGYSDYVLACDGAIDSLIARLPDSLRRAGFDAVGTPFAELTGESSVWKYGYPDFRLRDFCDGYIIQMPLKQYEGVAVAEGFINEQNRVAAILQKGNPNTKDTTETLESILRWIGNDTEIQRLFKNELPDYATLPD